MIHGDSLAGMHELEDASVDLVMTSMRPSTSFGWDAAVGRQPLQRRGLPKKLPGFSPSRASPKKSMVMLNRRITFDGSLRSLLKFAEF